MDKNVILLGVLGYLAVIAKSIPSIVCEFLLKQIAFSYSILSNNRFKYAALSSWILSLNKKCFYNNLNGIYYYTKSTRKDTLSINYGRYLTKIDKLTFLYVEKSLIPNNMDSYDNLTVVIFGLHKNKYKEILLNNVAVNDTEDKLIVYCNTYDSTLIPKKNMNKIFIESKDVLLRHIDNWVNNKNFYEENGIVYKTGILLYGSPGTGKTSISKAIASYLNYEVHIINLKVDAKSERELVSRIYNIPKKSIILLEDIDCILGNRNEKDLTPEQKSMIGTVLNILDGILSPNEVIFVATTNHIENLDDALIRSGRFDLKIKVDNISKEIATEMCNEFKVDPEELLTNETFPINPAYLQNKILAKIGGINNN